MGEGSTGSGVLRAAALGLMLACAAGGLAIAGVGAWHLLHVPSCGALAANECALERATTRELAGYQLFAGAALLLLGAALWSQLRPAAPKA